MGRYHRTPRKPTVLGRDYLALCLLSTGSADAEAGLGTSGEEAPVWLMANPFASEKSIVIQLCQ